MSQKNQNNPDSNEPEIVDVDYDIESDINKSDEKSSSSNIPEGEPSVSTTHNELLDELKLAYKQLEEKEEQYNKMHDRYLRALADYENLDKRSRLERARMAEKANERIFLKLIDLADSFDKAEASMSEKEAPPHDSNFEGFKAVRKQFDSILKNEGFERISALGEKFDPNFHEVVYVKSDSEYEEDFILEEVQIGYLLNSKVLRPTKVVVAKTKTKGEK
ncbi:MAG: nucleotide exchange factor GrpE [Candidatus Hodarchaeales archaeon]|jgi:molecular chaperone GrpE